MMDNRRDGKKRSATDERATANDQKNLVSKRDEQLDEEIRGQLRKKNEESKRNMGGSGRSNAPRG